MTLKWKVTRMIWSALFEVEWWYCTVNCTPCIIFGILLRLCTFNHAHLNSIPSLSKYFGIHLCKVSSYLYFIVDKHHHTFHLSDVQVGCNAGTKIQLFSTILTSSTCCQTWELFNIPQCFFGHFPLRNRRRLCFNSSANLNGPTPETSYGRFRYTEAHRTIFSSLAKLLNLAATFPLHIHTLLTLF